MICRVWTCGVGMMTPALFAATSKGTFLFLAVIAVIGYCFAIWAFGGNRARNEFATEEQIVSE